MIQIWNLSLAILASLGGGTLIVAAFSTWLGKVWASRILEKDRSKYQAEMEQIKSEISKKIHEHNVAVSRIDAHRAETIQKIYTQLVNCYSLIIEIRPPYGNIEAEEVIFSYIERSKKLESEISELDILVLQSAISVTEETYKIVVKCCYTLSQQARTYKIVIGKNAILENKAEALENIKKEAIRINTILIQEFNPAKEALSIEFRKILDPRLL